MGYKEPIGLKIVIAVSAIIAVWALLGIVFDLHSMQARCERINALSPQDKAVVEKCVESLEAKYKVLTYADYEKLQEKAERKVSNGEEEMDAR